MQYRFEGQVAIVTGAARGIGKGIALRLAREGARVFLVDCLGDELDLTVAEMKGEGLRIDALRVDIANELQVREAFEEVARRASRLDIMVNSAGIVGPTGTTIENYSFADFRQVLDVNLSGAFLMTKYAIPAMLQTGYGRIVLIASIGGKEGNPGMAGYAASKSGVMGLVKAVGKEYAESGITVNGIAPAVIATPMNQDTDPKLLKYMTDRIPMKRLGTVEEVTSLACWIVSKEASFNTGFVFDLSGGRATY
ncbi:MAG: SDR family oxidoreductase [Acidobacteriota bacterium]|nr:MAG: SDR family oxidoreductase [Acidobacteriota bacterium]